MPGRVSVRSSRPSTVNVKGRLPRAAASIDNTPDEGPSTALREQICTIFGEAQLSSTGQRKLVVGLRRIQEECCYEPVKPKKQQANQDFDENDFNAEVTRCVLRVLPVKKSEPAGDRIVKYLGLFLKHATSADNAVFQEEDAEGQQLLPETPTSRLTSQILSQTLPLLPAKDKVVRFRATQIVAHIVNTLDSIDDGLFDHIRLGLLRRLRDKETNVRVQAVYGLGRLAGEADGVEDDAEDSDDDTAGGVLEKLLDVLQNDPSAEVRRALLLNLPFTSVTLPYLLERARDLDSGIRRALYSRLLPALGDFRHLSLTHREKLLRWGLRDRDDQVRKATARLFRERWIEDCARPRDEDGEPIDMKPGEVCSPSSDGLLELLERIDVVNAGNDGGIALDAMREFWEGRPDYREFITFGEDFWNEVTPESAFVARSFNDYCQKQGASDKLVEKMPEVTRFAFLLQQNINKLVENVQRIAVQEDAEEDSVYQEFVVEQLLHIALTLDYADEVGRRTMYSLMREALALAELPEETTRLVIEVLRIACGFHATSERDFCGVILEAIAEVHDTIMGDESLKAVTDPDDSFHSAKSALSGDRTPVSSMDQEEEVDEEKAIREIMVNMKCLHIAQCMLQNVECGLEQNVHLVTMLNNLIVPAVRSQEAPIRERGLVCLGLCCLLDKNLAAENLTLFLHCFTKGHEALQNIAIQIVGDILSAHPSLLFAPKRTTSEEDEELQDEHSLHKPIHKLFSKGLKSPSGPIQSTACTSLCKLMLSAPSAASAATQSILNNDELLRLLVVAYFDPETVGNHALRQTLSYFLPVYCHSRKENMQRMGRIALSVLHWCVSAKEEMEVDGEEEISGDMVGLSVVIAHLVDWTDGRKLAAALRGVEDEIAKDAETDVHLDLAIEILEKILGVCSKEERKFYMSMLGKLVISSNSDSSKLRMVADLVNDALEDKIANDTTARNTLQKIQTAVSKANNSQYQSQGASRRASIVYEDGEVACTLQDSGEGEGGDDPSPMETITEDVVLETTANTPAPSPRKKATRRPKVVTTQNVREIMKEDGNEPEGNRISEGEAEDGLNHVSMIVETMLNVKTEDAEYGKQTQIKTPMDRGRWSGGSAETLEPEHMKLSQCTDGDITPASELSEVPTEVVVRVEEEAARRRGRRVPRSSSTTTAAAPRRSVRSSRRQTANGPGLDYSEE